MANINLLPWREQANQKRQQQFIAIIAAMVLLSVGIVGATLTVIEAQISNQQQRNAYLAAEEARLDEKIAEIKALKEVKANLERRMRLVERLQNARNLPTYLLDELARIVAPGVYLSSVERKGQNLWINGKSESNNHLANMLRNVEESQWFSNSMIEQIETQDDEFRKLNNFSLRISIKIDKSDEETEDGV